MHRTFFRYLPFALLAAGLAGCRTTDPADPMQGLIPSPVSPISDVPIPAGFRMANDSQTYLAPNQLRIAHHHYKGGDDFLSVARFYREQLPLKGWTLLSQQQNGGIVILAFSKPTEDLTVTVSEGTLDTHVYVKLDPSNRNPAPPR